MASFDSMYGNLVGQVKQYQAGALPSQNPYGQMAQQGLQGAQEAGFFSPTGSPALRETLRTS